MGITPEALVWLMGRLPVGKGPAQPAMLELGNQTLYVPKPPYPGFPPKHLNRTSSPDHMAKPFFESVGWRHVSVDLNGQGGAKVHDLCQPLQFVDPFDVATDFGTSEHVRDLYWCLRNLHDNTRKGSRIFHANPEPRSWPGHGFWYRSHAFYEEYAALAGYEILDLHRAPACGNTTDGWETRAVLVRGKGEFPSREAFNQLPLGTE